ncbi:MAG: HypC/HybG/HupF family hydrogenase formation chaperone [Mangrovicoccus sp.]|nr:HypC/HybG/HupF family hydrogenase formation chaperone [Mangrovicoccus sp.]
MCIGQPLQIHSVDGIAAIAGHGAHQEVIDLSLTPQAQPGDWVLCFLGAARDVISGDEAAKISAALDGLRAVMAGGDAGDAFADLDARAPQLPPHLQAARDAGRSTG